MFGKIKEILHELTDGDQWPFTIKKSDTAFIKGRWVTISKKNKRMYIEARGDNSIIHLIYEYVLNGNNILIKEIQHTIYYTQPKREKIFLMKNGDVVADGIYKYYNDPKNFLKEGTLDKDIEKYKKLCLLHPLNDIELTMFILSKNLDSDSLKKAANEKINLMKNGRKQYDTMISGFGVSPDYDYFEKVKRLKKNGKLEEYNDGVAKICEKCGCLDVEIISGFDETIKLIESYKR